VYINLPKSQDRVIIFIDAAKSCRSNQHSSRKYQTFIRTTGLEIAITKNDQKTIKTKPQKLLGEIAKWL